MTVLQSEADRRLGQGLTQDMDHSGSPLLCINWVGYPKRGVGEDHTGHCQRLHWQPPREL